MKLKKQLFIFCSVITLSQFVVCQQQSQPLATTNPDDFALVEKPTLERQDCFALCRALQAKKFTLFAHQDSQNDVTIVIKEGTKEFYFYPIHFHIITGIIRSGLPGLDDHKWATVKDILAGNDTTRMLTYDTSDPQLSFKTEISASNEDPFCTYLRDANKRRQQ